MDRSTHQVLTIPGSEIVEDELLGTGRRWQAFKRDRVLLTGIGIVAAYLLIALLAALIAPADPYASFNGARLAAPSAAHLFGTDDYSRDVFSRVIYGTQISMAVGLSVTVLTTILGGLLGLLTGYYPWLDRSVTRVLDGLMAFPGILLAIAIAAALQPSVITVIVALTIVYTPYAARILRAPVLANRGTLYVESARALGAKDLRILLQHLLPNSVVPLLVQATFTFSFAVLAEATLSFLGVGVPPPIPSWGNMLDSAKLYLSNASWMAWAPGLALVVVTLGLNFVGDGLRDLLDPHAWT